MTLPIPTMEPHVGRTICGEVRIRDLLIGAQLLRQPAGDQVTTA